MDEARFGQQGTTTRVWARKGSRPTAVKQTRITILYLPPYSPELNPVERLWAYLRSHYLHNRAFDEYQHLLDAGAQAWQRLTPDLLRSVCACPYVTPELGR